MANHNPANERIKRRYFVFLKEAKRHSDATVDAVAKAIARFEADTNYRDFKAFHFEQARAFKRHLGEQCSEATGRNLSKATLHATLAHLKRFFQWLAAEPGYRSRLKYSDAEYFNLSEKDTRVATARREKNFPTIEQVKDVIAKMPHASEIEQRDRAIVAFALLTGARDGAIASFKLKHVNLVDGSVYQDARDVNTKFSKTFPTFFFRIGDDILQILADWVTYLREVKMWDNDDPLFPATQVALGASRQFEVAGLKRDHWSNAAAIRTIFRKAFRQAGQPYFNPHSLRDTLAHLGEERCQTPREFKAWSQNLGHEGVLTTLYSYGNVRTQQQGEIIRNLTESNRSNRSNRPDAEEFAKAVARHLRNPGTIP